jgi:hypothetical protein
MMQQRCFPTYEEIRALEAAARRAQSEEIFRVAALAAGKLKALAGTFLAALSGAPDKPAAVATGGGLRDSDARPTLLSILEDLAASLPDELRARYAEELLTAARVAPVIDLGFATWDFTVRTVAGIIHGIAQGLRAGAWCLDVAARRIMPLP